MNYNVSTNFYLYMRTVRRTRSIKVHQRNIKLNNFILTLELFLINELNSIKIFYTHKNISINSQVKI